MQGEFHMKYNFKTTQTERNGQSIKWNLMYNHNKNASFIPLTVADMEFETAPEIVDALTHYIQTQPLGYSNPNQDYYDSVLYWFKNTQNLDLNQKEIVLTNGVISALHALIHVLTKPGDEILITSPVYSHFFSAPTSMDRVPLDVPLIYKDTYAMDYNAIDTALSNSKCKLMILCNPHNPVGRVWTKKELEKLHTITKKHGVLVISDEIHSDIILSGNTFTSFRHIDKDCILCTSASKTFNLAGLQTANIFIPNKKTRTDVINFHKYSGIHDPNALGYIATQAAYTEAYNWHKESLQVIHDNFILLKSLLENSPYKVIPLEGTYLMLIDYTALNVDEKTMMDTLKTNDLYVGKGTDYGKSGVGFIRINIALPNTYIESIAKILLQVVEEL